MPDRLEEFGSALLNPDLPVPAGIVGPDGRPSVRRFAVYRNNVVVSLIEAVTAAYPVVVRLVGEQFFRAMARIYVVRHPPASPIMLQYGEGFADFIATFPPAASVPYLADIARLERAWSEAYHAREAWAASLENLASIPAEAFGHVRLRLHPSLRLVSSRFPIVTIWTMNIQGGVPAPVDLSAHQNALVLRPRSEVEVRSLANDSAAFVAALHRGDTAEDAAKGALKVNPKFDLVGNLRDLMNLGLVAGWELDDIEFDLGVTVMSLPSSRLAIDPARPKVQLINLTRAIVRAFAAAAGYLAPPVLRVALALPFFRSGLTRWDGVLSLSPATSFLFSQMFKLHILGGEYPIPFPDVVSYLVAIAEIGLPILLVLGLGTRLAALGLLMMTAVIQLVVPDGWINFHLYWAAIALAIMALGAGPISLDRLIAMFSNRVYEGMRRGS